MEFIYLALVFLGLVSELITILLLIKYGSIGLPKIWKPICYMTIAGFFTDFFSLISLFFFSYNYIFLYLYSMVEIICFFVIFRDFLDNFKLRNLLLYISIIQLLVFFSELIINGINEINYISNFLNKIVVIFYSSYFSFKEYKNAFKEKSKPYFNVFMIFVFYSLAIFYFSLFETTIKSHSFLYNFLWPIPMLSTISLNFFISLTIWKKRT